MSLFANRQKRSQANCRPLIIVEAYLYKLCPNYLYVSVKRKRYSWNCFQQKVSMFKLLCGAAGVMAHGRYGNILYLYRIGTSGVNIQGG